MWTHSAPPFAPSPGLDGWRGIINSLDELRLDPNGVRLIGILRRMTLGYDKLEVSKLADGFDSECLSQRLLNNARRADVCCLVQVGRNLHDANKVPALKLGVGFTI